MKRNHLKKVILTILFLITVLLAVTGCVCTKSQGNAGYGRAFSQKVAPSSPFSYYFSYR